MKSHRRVSHDRFRPCGCDFEETAGLFHNLVSDKVKVSFLGLVNDFLVGKRRLRSRIPIDYAAAAINQTFMIKIDENVLDSPDVGIIEGITLPRPIARTAQALELLDDNAAMFVLPFQYPAQEFFAA